MEHEFQDIVIKTEFLKTSKVKIKKDIEFYKTVLNKLVRSWLLRASFMMWLPSDLIGYINIPLHNISIHFLYFSHNSYSIENDRLTAFPLFPHQARP